MNDITTRFLEVYEYLKNNGIVQNPSNFAKEIDVSSSTITEICKGRTDAGIKPIKGLIKRFTQVNSNWLLVGEGEMIDLINYSEDSEDSEDSESLNLEDPKVEFLKKFELFKDFMSGDKEVKTKLDLILQNQVKILDRLDRGILKDVIAAEKEKLKEKVKGN